MACAHPKPAGRTQCNECQAAYMRAYRKTSKSLHERRAERRGAEDLRALIVARFDGWPVAMSGTEIAEMVRKIGMD